MKRNKKNTLFIQQLTRSRKFHVDTKIHNYNLSKTSPYSTWPDAWKKIYYKAYPRFEQVILPEPKCYKYDLINVLFNRESCRKFSTQPLTREHFSDFLYFVGGMKNFVKRDNSTKRFYPSAGGRYPLEIYPFIFNVEHINSSIYHYHIKTHSLEIILKPPVFADTFKQFSQPWMKKAAALIIVTAIFDRTEIKYKDRGYRHILTEYGHIAQNAYLMATALNFGCCSIGGFIDDGLNKLLDVDGIEESVIGVITIGNKDTNK